MTATPRGCERRPTPDSAIIEHADAPHAPVAVVHEQLGELVYSRDRSDVRDRLGKLTVAVELLTTTTTCPSTVIQLDHAKEPAALSHCVPA